MRTLILASMLGLATLNGCATTGFGYHHHYGHYGHHGGGGGIALLTGMIVGVAISEGLHDAPSEPEVHPAYVPAPSDAPPPPPMLAPRPSAPPEDARVPALDSFDPIVARNALHAVDLRACHDAQAAPIGYGHAKVTFNPDGSVKTILVDSPAGLNEAVVACIGAKLSEARVPEFRGPATTAGFAFRIE